MALDDDDVDKILAHIDSQHVPDSLDRSELRKDILAAWDFYQGYKREDAKSARTGRCEYATKVARTADELFHLLNKPGQEAEWVRRSIGRSLLDIESDAASSLAPLTHGLMKLVNVASYTARKCTGKASIRAILEVPPSFWLIGHDLVLGFEKHFEGQAKRTRSQDGQPSGPFVQFATAVTAQLGDPFTDETVSKAISAVRKWQASPLNN